MKLDSQGRRQRGNPNWLNPVPPTLSPPQKSEFEILVERLKLSPEQWPGSRKLRDFARAHRNNLYVPESLLMVWGLQGWDDEA